MKNKIILFSFVFTIIISVLFSNIVYSQVSVGGVPRSFNNQVRSTIDTVTMPSINIDSIKLAENKPSITKFGHAINVDFGISNVGTWDTLSNGDKIWRLAIYSPNAYSINLIYDEFWLSAGAEFFVYNHEKNHLLGAFTELNNKTHGKFSTSLVEGDITVLEYFEPSNAQASIINIDKVIHAYKNTFGESGVPEPIHDCHVDVLCPTGNDWCVEKRTVARILINNNTAWCSGALINNVKEDLTPYFLTARHCLHECHLDWETNIFEFLFWSPTCNEGDPPVHSRSISGAYIKAKHNYTDFALLELSTPPPSGFGILYAGWDRISEPSTSSTVIHHPRGAPMKITNSVEPAEIGTYGFVPYPPPNTCWKILYDQGTTENGSSGSPLFNQNHRIVGQLWGPGAYITGCPEDYNIYNLFGRFDMSWDIGNNEEERLRDWLDPENTGITSIGPTSPPIFLINRTLTGNYKFAALKDLHIEGNVTTNIYPICQPSNVPFTAEPGAHVEIKAKSITIHPGTTFKAGSNVTITATDEIICEDNIVAGDFYENCYVAGNIVPTMQTHNIIDNRNYLGAKI